MADTYIRWPTVSGGGSAGVSSLNTLTGAITLAAGTDISITPSGNTLTIANTASAVTPGGTSGQVQYNNSGAFGGFGSWNGTTFGVTGNGNFSGTLAVGSTSVFTGNIIANAGAGFTGNMGFYGASEIAQPTGNIFTALSNLGLVATPTMALTNLPTQATNTILGNVSGSSASPIALTVAQVNTMLGDILANGTVAMSASLNLGTNQIINVVDPTTAQMAATKNYVDTVASGIEPIQAVYAATTLTNIAGTYLNGASGVGATFTTTSTATFTLDGTTPPLNSRILFKDQTTGFQNGVYTFTALPVSSVSGAVFTRSLDYNTAADMNAGGLIPVINGTSNAQTSWLQTATITNVGTDALVFIQWTANPANYLLKANNLSDVASKTAAFNTISPMTTGGDLIYGGASGAATRLANGSAGQVLTSAGTTLAPTWVTAIPIANGGTGQTTAAAAFSALSPITTTGDLIYSSSGTTNSRLGIGTTGQVLTVASGVPTWASFKAPTVQSFTSGSGTYTTPSSPKPLYLKIKMVAGGGGGAGGPGSGSSNGGGGGNTTFGSSVLTASGGSGGTVSGAGGAGGGASIAGGAIGFALQGGTGSGATETNVSGVSPGGGAGGTNPFGGGGGGGVGSNQQGLNAAASTGAGGGGGGSASASNGSPGGGAGGYVEAIIGSPASSYAYAVAAAGTAGSGGTGSGAGGTGGSGFIVVEEYYQ